MIVLVVSFVNGNGSGLTSKTSSKVNLLNDDIYQCATSFRQIEQGVHYIRKSLIYSMRKAFLERAVVELVYKFDKKSYRECFVKVS